MRWGARGGGATYRTVRGGEGGSRTHEPGFARLPAFEAGSFDHSDTSPRWLSHSNGGAAAEQRRMRHKKNLHREHGVSAQRNRAGVALLAGTP